jgi:multiple sugar transport system permease protein
MAIVSKSGAEKVREESARPTPTRETGGSNLLARIRRNIWGYVFVSPWVLLYLVFGLYPLLLSFYLTFFNYSFVRPQDEAFTGIGNWLRGITDGLFWIGLFNIVYNQAIFIFLKNGLGLLIALGLKRITKGGRIFRTIYFMPVITSPVVLVLVGAYIVSPDGPLQGIFLQAGIIKEPVFWKFADWLPMPVIALINSWKWFGVSTIILLAGLYGIDPTLYEASSLDGASAWQRFRYITWSLLRPQLFFLLVVDLINGLQMFSEVYALGYDVYGGPNHQALTPVMYVYAQAFDRSNVGYSSALGLILAGIIAIVTLIQFKFVSKDTTSGD